MTCGDPLDHPYRSRKAHAGTGGGNYRGGEVGRTVQIPISDNAYPSAFEDEPWQRLLISPPRAP
jgi:hypothetical protein